MCRYVVGYQGSRLHYVDNHTAVAICGNCCCLYSLTGGLNSHLLWGPGVGLQTSAFHMERQCLAIAEKVSPTILFFFTMFYRYNWNWGMFFFPFDASSSCVCWQAVYWLDDWLQGLKPVVHVHLLQNENMEIATLTGESDIANMICCYQLTFLLLVAMISETVIAWESAQ